MSAKFAYLTQPAPNVYLLNLQTEEGFQCIEITKAQLANIVVDGAAMALKDLNSTLQGCLDKSVHRVPVTPTENANDREHWR